MQKIPSKLKTKFLVICTAPALVMAIILSIVTVIELQSLKEEEMVAERENRYTQKQKELKSLVEMALSTMASTLAQPPSPERDDAIIEIVHSLKFDGGAGYFFVNSYDMFAIANGRIDRFAKRPIRYTRSSPNVKHRLEVMVDIAKAGGGYQEYESPRKGEDDPEKQYPKLAYVQNVPGYDWLIGTGYYIDDIDDAVAARRDKFDATLSSIFVTTGIVTLIILGLSVLTCALLVTGALKPLNNMYLALRDIASGQGDLTKKLSIENNDEVGVCAKSFNDFSEKIRNIVMTVSEEAGVINTSTGMLDDSTKISLERVHDQRVKAQTLTTEINHMLSTAKDITQKCSQASKSAQEVDEESGESLKALTSAVEKLITLDADVNKSAGAISELHNESQSITSVLEVIQQIAEQTNLLALNAAIEAARAGEQGRGFAVVADEVRTLASRTKSSTEDIERMIDGLQSKAESAVASMEVSRSSSGESKEMAEKSKASLERMSIAIADINSMNTQIAAAADEQTHVTETLNKSVQDLFQMTEDTEQECKNIAETSTSLKANASALSKEMSYFTV